MDALALSKVLVRCLALVLWLAALICLVVYAIEALDGGSGVADRLHDRYFVVVGVRWLVIAITLVLLGGVVHLCGTPLARWISSAAQ
jgi:hypothetical protein